MSKVMLNRVIDSFLIIIAIVLPIRWPSEVCVVPGVYERVVYIQVTDQRQEPPDGWPATSQRHRHQQQVQ